MRHWRESVPFIREYVHKEDSTHEIKETHHLLDDDAMAMKGSKSCDLLVCF